LHTLRQHFLQHVCEPDCITRTEFLRIPSVAVNPLKDRLCVCFGFGAAAADGTCAPSSKTFRDFLEVLSAFNNPTAPAEHKLRIAFQMQDFDDDGELSKADLVK
jgi:hypothetical protein